MLEEVKRECMSSSVRTTRRNWDDPETCPFCGAALADGGGAFVRHVETRDDCAVRFDAWRQRVAGDVGGEWTG